MARKGRFGRLPRTSPDLTATIVSMVREYQNLRDRNIVNAWEKGGEFEGKPATDEMLMDHLRMRKDEVSPDDPLYDEYGQRIYEYEFAIANSKQELKYAEGKATDMEMSKFYRDWAAKLPKNSEAWRNNMTLAAQYKDRAAQAGRGGGGGGRGGGGGGGYNSVLNRFPTDKETAYDVTLDTLNNVAHALGVLNDVDETLGDLRAIEGDASLLITVLDKFNNDPFYAEDKAEATEWIRDHGNPNFSGDFTIEMLTSEKSNKDAGMRERLRRAQAAGHKTDIKWLTKEIEKMDEAFMEATAAGPLARYESYRKQFEDVKNDPTANPIDLYIGYQKYAGQLTGLDQYMTDMYGAVSGSLSVATMQGHLRSEISALFGEEVDQPNLMDDSRGETTTNSGDTAEISGIRRQLDAEMVLLGSGMGVITRTDEAGQPSATGSEYGVVPLSAMAQFGQNVVMVPANGANAAIVNVNGVDFDFSAVMTAVLPSPVNVTGTSGAVDQFGNPAKTGVAPTTGGSQVANIYEMPGGTKLIQYFMPDGSKRFTNAESIFVGRDGNPIKPMRGTDGNYTVTVPLGATVGAFTGASTIDPDYMDPNKTQLMPNTVSMTSYTVWVSSQRTMNSDPGVAYALDMDAVRLSVQQDMAHVDPNTLQGMHTLRAAYNETEQARLDYLQNTPNIDVRLRRAAELNRTVTAADAAGLDEARANADFRGLSRDVEEYYARLRAGKIMTPAEVARLEEKGTSAPLIQAKKDETIRQMLMGGGGLSAEAERARMEEAGWMRQADAIRKQTAASSVNDFYARLRKTGVVGSGRGASPSTLTYGGTEKVKPGAGIRQLVQNATFPVPGAPSARANTMPWRSSTPATGPGHGGYGNVPFGGAKPATPPPRYVPTVGPMTGPAAGPNATIMPPRYKPPTLAPKMTGPAAGPNATTYTPPKLTLNIPKAKLEQLKLL